MSGERRKTRSHGRQDHTPGAHARSTKSSFYDPRAELRGGVTADNRPWYHAGLRFGCTACGKCCRNHGDGYQHVWSTLAERRAIAESLGLTVREFSRAYCERRGGGLSFRSKGDACVFLSAAGQCSIYEHRPAQCRTFPFWPELIADERTWKRDVESFCPGVGAGPLHDRAAIEAAAKECDG